MFFVVAVNAYLHWSTILEFHTYSTFIFTIMLSMTAILDCVCVLACMWACGMAEDTAFMEVFWDSLSYYWNPLIRSYLFSISKMVRALWNLKAKKVATSAHFLFHHLGQKLGVIFKCLRIIYRIVGRPTLKRVPVAETGFWGRSYQNSVIRCNTKCPIQK